MCCESKSKCALLPTAVCIEDQLYWSFVPYLFIDLFCPFLCLGLSLDGTVATAQLDREWNFYGCSNINYMWLS